MQPENARVREALVIRVLTGHPSADLTGPTVDFVHSKADVREFLASRRARITPVQAGLPGGSGRRRVLGLRWEEVALLAGVSSEHYARLDRGRSRRVSNAFSTG